MPEPSLGRGLILLNFEDLATSESAATMSSLNDGMHMADVGERKSKKTKSALGDRETSSE
jgi:hypothetical protein